MENRIALRIRMMGKDHPRDKALLFFSMMAKTKHTQASSIQVALQDPARTPTSSTTHCRSIWAHVDPCMHHLMHSPTMVESSVKQVATNGQSSPLSLVENQAQLLLEV